jgi:hypothetical protein
MELELQVLEEWSETAHATTPWSDEPVSLAAYLAYDEGALEEIPQALEAYLAHDQLTTYY